MFNKHKMLADILGHLADQEEAKHFDLGGVSMPTMPQSPQIPIPGGNLSLPGSGNTNDSVYDPLGGGGVQFSGGTQQVANQLSGGKSLNQYADQTGGKLSAGAKDIEHGKNPINGADTHGHGNGVFGNGNPLLNKSPGSPDLNFDKFKATNPNAADTTTNTNFQPIMDNGLNNINAGSNVLGNAANGLQGTAARQTNIAQTLTDQGPGSILSNQQQVGKQLNQIGTQQQSQAAGIGALSQPLVGPNGYASQQANTGNQIGNLAGPQGLGSVLGQQQSLAQTLQNQANGGGPNPAQLQFQQNANQNLQQAAGQIASQKGISPALAARLIAQQSGNNSQANAANAATLQAQQQLAAQNQLGQNLQAQGNTVQGQGALLGQQVGALTNAANTQQGGANIQNTGVGAQSQAANTIANQGTNLTQQTGTLNAGSNALSGAGTAQAGLGTVGANQANAGNTTLSTGVGGQTAQNNAITAGSLGTQGLNAGVAGINAINTANITGSGINGAAGVTGAILGGGGDPNAAVRGINQQQPGFVGPPTGYKGGIVPHMSQGGLMDDAVNQSSTSTSDVVQQILKDPKQVPQSQSYQGYQAQTNPFQAYQKGARGYAQGGDVLAQGEQGSQNQSDQVLGNILKTDAAMDSDPFKAGQGKAASPIGSAVGSAAPGLLAKLSSLFGAGATQAPLDIAGAGGAGGEGVGWAGADTGAAGGADAAAAEGAAEGVAAVAYKGGKVKPLLKQSSAEVAAKANPSLAQRLMAMGGEIPGTPQVPTNALKNDTVPAILSPEEVVLPLSVTKSQDPAEAAYTFMEKLKAKASPSYGKVLRAKQNLAQVMAAHNKCQGGYP